MNKIIEKIVNIYKKYRYVIYISIFLIFMFIFERTVLDGFIKFVFVDVLEPLISDAAKQGELAKYVAGLIIAAIASIIKARKK